MSNPHNTYSRVKFKAWFNGEQKIFEVKGRKARTIIALVQAGKKGITALEMSSWAYRLAAYIHQLKNGNFNLDISRQDEKHDGGQHGRYFLITPVEIIEVS